MIRVIVEMLPLGVESKKRHLGKMYIDNIGGTELTADYRVRLAKEDGVLLFQGEIKDYQRSLGWGRLVRKAFNEAYPLGKRELINAKLEESNTKRSEEGKEKVRDEGVGTVSETTDAINDAKSRTSKRKVEKQ